MFQLINNSLLVMFYAYLIGFVVSFVLCVITSMFIDKRKPSLYTITLALFVSFASWLGVFAILKVLMDNFRRKQ